jgi:hypothetical protein
LVHVRVATPVREIRAQRLRDEVGTIHKQSALPWRWSIPSPYTSGCPRSGSRPSTADQRAAGHSAERAFLPDDVADARRRREGAAPTSRAARSADFPVVAFSVAYELELAGLVDCLDLAGIPALAADRARAPASTRWW